ncbi:hypothetical protein IDJ77_22705 [Mucilaginibacter sp. ZT4R22]|uniref:FG-GAP repeat protein n=1 Tax=Mucilaginibacter pankratovii TaxID=2772110 RepID=A0ABR7WWH0_9SPHI|nr:hypothetical protein [Mucilaginibacter pankratovii]MBD1366640.1 hypothetical protein [Mucilaginibacter pankratovii]
MLSRLFFVCFLFIFPVACVQLDKERPTKPEKESSKPYLSNHKLGLNSNLDTIVSKNEVFVDGLHFTLVSTSLKTYLLRGKDDTIFKVAENAPIVDPRDFNGDGYKDFRIGFTSDALGSENLWLYVKEKKTYKKVIHFSDFHTAKRIPKTNYYYSYDVKYPCVLVVDPSDASRYRGDKSEKYRGQNITSELFYIKNFEVKKIGSLKQYACDADEKKGVHIYRFKNGKGIRYAEFPVQAIGGNDFYRYFFFERYWAKNYRLFL